MENSELDKLEALAKVATPGPWTAWYHNSKVFYGEAGKNSPGNYSPMGSDLIEICDTDNGRDDEYEDVEPGAPEDDAAYIAAAHPQTILSLVAETRRLRAADNWISVTELPALIGTQSINYSVLTKQGKVFQAQYTQNLYCKTEKARQPRWEWHGRLFPFGEITHYQPMPQPPTHPDHAS